MFFPPRREGVDAFDDRLVFWGCGMRSENGLSPENLARSEIFRRPGSTQPLGPQAGRCHPPRGLCLPGPRPPRLPARPGHHREDDVCTAHPGPAERCRDPGAHRVRVVIRTALPASKQALHTFIDQVASAEFVLAGAMHAAVIAAGYGRPFAFWNNGHLDLPFKWADLAASLSIENAFAPDLERGRAVHAERIPAGDAPPSSLAAARLGAARDPARGGDEGAAARVAGPACWRRALPEARSVDRPPAADRRALRSRGGRCTPPLERAPDRRADPERGDTLRSRARPRIAARAAGRRAPHRAGSARGSVRRTPPRAGGRHGEGRRAL